MALIGGGRWSDPTGSFLFAIPRHAAELRAPFLRNPCNSYREDYIYEKRALQPSITTISTLGSPAK
jgi:hypothetical protein